MSDSSHLIEASIFIIILRYCSVIVTNTLRSSTKLMIRNNRL
nr:MAG TPA: hypothetical protein [Caudoviricetes sp.]